MSPSSTLAYWQRLHGLSDERAAELLGLRRGEYLRQRADRPSRQTAIIAAILTVYGLDFGELAHRANNGTDPVA